MEGIAETQAPVSESTAPVSTVESESPAIAAEPTDTVITPEVSTTPVTETPATEQKENVEVKESTTTEVTMQNYTEGSSLMPSIINMMNTIIGAGTISLPSTILDGGIIGGGLLLLISLILSLYGAHYLSAASIYTQEDSYGFIGKKLINKGCGYAADFFMILFDFGIAIGYCNIVFGQTVDLISSYTNYTWDVVNNNKWVSKVTIQ